LSFFILDLQPFIWKCLHWHYSSSHRHWAI